MILSIIASSPFFQYIQNAQKNIIKTNIREILEDLIVRMKKFEINSTPTLIINNKKFDKPLTFKNLKKAIEKLI